MAVLPRVPAGDVKTHDVAITNLSAPQSAKVGQTRQINVNIKNTRSPETVRVELLKSIPGGFQSIASTEQNIPVRSGNHTTAVGLSYTFTDVTQRWARLPSNPWCTSSTPAMRCLPIMKPLLHRRRSAANTLRDRT